MITYIKTNGNLKAKRGDIIFLNNGDYGVVTIEHEHTDAFIFYISYKDTHPDEKGIYSEDVIAVQQRVQNEELEQLSKAYIKICGGNENEKQH